MIRNHARAWILGLLFGRQHHHRLGARSARRSPGGLDRRRRSLRAVGRFLHRAAVPGGHRRRCALAPWRGCQGRAHVQGLEGHAYPAGAHCRQCRRDRGALGRVGWRAPLGEGRPREGSCQGGRAQWRPSQAGWLPPAPRGHGPEAPGRELLRLTLSRPDVVGRAGPDPVARLSTQQGGQVAGRQAQPDTPGAPASA